jgi:UDP-N-acetylglucosamine 2-epimerase (non-hydrolysing)
MTVFGTRPDAIKMAPVVHALLADPRFDVRLIATGQHREMLDQVMRVFHLKPDVDLKVMTHGQSLTQMTTRMMEGLDSRLQVEKPDVLLAQGDTTTTFAAALTAFYHKVPFGHVEAGLRTYDMFNPFPEEMNRRLAAPIASFHFAPTGQAKNNLLQEHIPAEKIWVTGNTGIDAVLWVANQPFQYEDPKLEQILNLPGRIILVTTHRRENWGEPMVQIATAVRNLLERFPDTYLVLPMHRNPLVREVLQAQLANHLRVHLIEPLEYAPFVHLMKHASLILTDSGGVQEEAPSLGKPLLVLRKTTERPEGVQAGTAKLVGTDPDTIVTEAVRLLEDETAYLQMAQAVNPYGDGKAAERIRDVLGNELR